jgi:hypothetical protein
MLKGIWASPMSSRGTKITHQWVSCNIIVHVDPQGVPVDYLRQPGRILPEGLAVSQIYTDYLVRLHGAAMESIKAKRGEAFITNLLLEQKVQYILTVPNAWLAGRYRRG